MYKVIVQFTDLQDHNHKYLPGETFPRAGLVVSEARLVELSTDKNRRHKPMIKAIDETPVKASEKPENDAKAEIPEDFINPPEQGDKEPKKVEEKPKPRRGRKKKDAE